ncbi:MAG: 4-alpha-glucanotransferase [Tannerella sp.]|jgi:4-alpha-glucanotransferase|nr:4-alpha-glucanotransferase [Tannerella sp.]
MEITFNIKYSTVWGQKLLITGSCTELGDGSIHAAKEMLYRDAGEWQLEIRLSGPVRELEYNYIIEDENGIRRMEEENFVHHAFFSDGCDSYFLYDYWLREPVDRTFYTSAFTRNLFARQEMTRADPPETPNDILLRLDAPEITPEQVVAVTGNQPCLGNWNTDHAVILSGANFPQWETGLHAGDISFPLEYKFIVLESRTNRLCYWEDGNNRRINSLYENKKGRMIINDCPLRTPEFSWKACGTVIPVFSLRSETGFGIGDIGDIKLLIDWAKKTGQHFIQLLPVNDTTRSHTWQDAYPYSAISIYALHPLYINIPMLGNLKDPERVRFYSAIQQKLNAADAVDYEAVARHKTGYLREYFRQEKENTVKNPDFKKFIAENREWLIPYAAFSYLRDKNNTADFSRWGEYAHYRREKIEPFCHPENEAYDELSYLFFIQYTLHIQFAAVAEYARRNRVVLKGDLPIGINRKSVEAWTEPEYFNMQEQAGAPPDAFSGTGQNWSFPTYNWEVMEKDGFSWWKKRFHNLNRYFDCFRIDHILGFFRIWEIPLEYTEGLCGHFRPALPLSVKEIEEGGITAFDERWTRPHIHIRYLPELFGEDVETDTLYKYLIHTDAKHLTLNGICSTQRKIKKIFEGKTDTKSQIIRDGLMTVANEVLFLEDPYRKKHYHPRISACKSYAYRELSDGNRHAFNRLYNDFYFLRHNEFWKQIALNRLTPLIRNTEMLVCGEDLGMIPASVHEVMEKLQIFTLEPERMPKAMNREFTDLGTLAYHSVCTTSTHDMSPIRTWWKEDREKTQRYYTSVLKQDGEAPEECSSGIAEQIILNHLKSSSMLTVIPLQDWFATDDRIKRKDPAAERINLPANPDNKWCYRMHIPLETLICTDSFNNKIKHLITASGRNK